MFQCYCLFIGVLNNSDAFRDPFTQLEQEKEEKEKEFEIRKAEMEKVLFEPFFVWVVLLVIIYQTSFEELIFFWF